MLLGELDGDDCSADQYEEISSIQVSAVPQGYLDRRGVLLLLFVVVVVVVAVVVGMMGMSHGCARLASSRPRAS